MMHSLIGLGRLRRSLWRRVLFSRHSPNRSVASSGASSSTSSNKIHDVIIVGGGPTGLLLSNLLSTYNIHSHLLFDKRPVNELLKHPQAHFINVRSMEILMAELPHVYNGVLKEMPSVGEWEGFHFGGSVIENNTNDDDDSGTSNVGGRRLGRVIHPVREPLKVGQTGDAMLVPKTETSSENDDSGTSFVVDGNDDPQYVSACRPAHLAQNKFVSLLLQEARRQMQSKHSTQHNSDANHETNDRLRYGEEVTNISQQPTEDQTSPIVTIQTSTGQSYHTRYLIAADGVHSFTRQQCNIPMLGDSAMQNLINVHFRTNQNLSKILMTKQNQAMLHFVYNSQLVGAFVCHDGNDGEWVLQIPYFPPYQTLDDFNAEKVRDMLWSGLGVHTTADEDTKLDFDILSIRPWTMSSLVAQSYVNDLKNIMLVGDAAHAFPPAGGFGMNTGLQDAHNLAWRLALLLNREENKQHNEAATSTFASKVLSKYDEERRPVATQNAALSVRNYQRTLTLAKACYLDAQHPQLLITLLSSPPLSMLPLEARSDMFRRLVRVAMMPLGSLVAAQKGAAKLHADHIEKNVRSILERGGSLPLVFPRYELGFSYNSNGAEDVAESKASDTAGYISTLKVGHRMPHVVVELLASSTFGKTDEGCEVMETRNSSVNSIQVSLTDISSVLHRVHTTPGPTFTLLSVGPELEKHAHIIEDALCSVAEEWGLHVLPVTILPTATKPARQYTGESTTLTTEYAVDKQQSLVRLLHEAKNGYNEEIHNALILVRPDGHIANIGWLDKIQVEESLMPQVKKVEDGFQNALGGHPSHPTNIECTEYSRQHSQQQDNRPM